MGTVTDLTKRIPEAEVWQCQCGCYTFWLYQSGIARCAQCDGEATEMTGHWLIPRSADGAAIIEAEPKERT